MFGNLKKKTKKIQLEKEVKFFFKLVVLISFLLFIPLYLQIYK